MTTLSAPAATFDEQRAAMSHSVATQPETAILSLLKAGLHEGKPVSAMAEAQKWLRQNLPEDAMLLYHAGRTAELSGEWKSAVSLYQQYLKRADFNALTADEAVYAVYTILLHRLNDTAGAYAFSRTEGDRLLVCPRARQFDTWFLDQAVRRQDTAAVANRLHGCIKVGLPSDLLVPLYNDYFHWLLSQFDGYCDHVVRVTRDVHDAVKGLASAIAFDQEMKLKLDWAVSVMAYNQAMIGGGNSGKAFGGKGKGNQGVKTDAAASTVEGQKREPADDVDPPIAEATALLHECPRYARWVQDGWAGGGNGQHYRNDPKRYWPHETDAKMAPIIAAASRLTPLEHAELLASWREGYYADNTVRPTRIKVVSDYVASNLKYVNSRTGVLVLEKPWTEVTPEEAQALAPRLEQNAHPEASMIRAIAAGGKDRNLDNMVAALLGAEAWRLNRVWLDGRGADQLWHYCGRPGGNEKRDAEIAKSKALAKVVLAGDVEQDAPLPQRMAAFEKLWADYRSPSPRIPGVYVRLAKVLQFTPEAIPDLIKDPDPEAQILARHVLEEGMSGPDPLWDEFGNWAKVSTGSYRPVTLEMARHHRGLEEMKRRYPQKCRPHPLEAALRQAVTDGLQQKNLQPWHVMAWINMQYPEDNAEQVKLMQALFKSPAWQTMPFEVQFAACEWFGKDAMTVAQAAWVDAADPVIVCRDLLSLTNVTDAATTAAALSNTMDRVKKSPVKIDMQGLDQLAAVPRMVFTDPKVLDLVLEVTDGLRDSSPSGALVQRLFELVSEKREPILLLRTAGYLWPYIVSVEPRSMYEPMKRLTASLVNDHPAVASALARCGVDALTAARNSYGFTPATHVPELKSIAGKAAMRLGLVIIPVEKTDPVYPVYKSQAEWLIANLDSAWSMLTEHWDELLPVHRELSVDYLMWVLERVMYSRDDVRMEELIKALLAWAGENDSPWTTEERIDLEVAYGDIALQLGQLDNAHKIFIRTQQSEAYEGLLGRHKATLRRVKVERIAKRFDDALKTLMQLDMARIPEMWIPSRFARAEVYYDMEEYADAADDIAAILARDPDHAEAKIMQGKIQLKRQKLMEASELDVGSKNAKNTLVPGEKLKVTLVDPTLAVSGAGTEVEVVVWATSGDRETFFLRQFGDQKTKFRGEVKTGLGAPNPGDDVLQVIGDDEICYAYSERFRKKMNDMEEKRGGPITVRSDAILMASARKLLSEAEQRVADMEAKMAEIAQGQHRVTARTAIQAKVKAAQEAVRDSRTREDREDAATRENERLAKALLRDRVKPGKAVNVRVIDPDCSRTADVDEVTVSIESSSGDSIGRVTLKETGTHTGRFEGSVPTAGAQAMAFARNSEPGRNPNMVISPTPGYPAWRPTAVGGVIPEFKVDLNDNVPLGALTITAKEPGAKLRKFVLQTGMNEKEMSTVAVFPWDIISLEKPWHPSVTIMNDTDHHHARNDRSVYDLREIEQHLEFGWMSQRYAAGIAENVVGLSAAMTNSVPGKVKWLRNNQHHNAHVIYRFRGYFYEPADVTRRFKAELGKWTPPKVHDSVAHPAQYLLAVDGSIITDKQKPGRLEGEVNLRRGLHRFEIWATGWDCRIGFGRSVKLMANLDPVTVRNLPKGSGSFLSLDAAASTGADKVADAAAVDNAMVEVPDSFFDPALFPMGALPHRNGRATIVANEDGTALTTTFAPGSRTRLLNLVLVDQEGPVPALNTMALAKPDGERVLPVAEDFALLNKNDTLEILTGDKVAVRYVDDRFVNKEKEKHERFLDVSFSDAGMGFVFFEMRKNRNGDLEPYHEELLRFAHGKPLHLRVVDPDMDMTDAPDTIRVVLESKTGGKREFEVTETGPSTAEFRLAVIPVPGTPANDREFRVAAGGTITATYRDEENVTPGVPRDRYARVEHALYRPPILRVAHATVSALNYKTMPPDERPGKRGLRIGFATRDERESEMRRLAAQAGEGLLARERETAASWSGGLVRPRWAINWSWADASRPPEGGIAAVHGQVLRLEIEAPHLALRSGSRVAVYVQTDAGREQGDLLRGTLDDAASEPGFDINVPGTMKLGAGLAGGPVRPHHLSTPPQIPIYLPGHLAHTDGSYTFKRSTTIFTCSVPLIASFLPEEGVLPEEEIERRRERRIPIETKHGLVVRPGENIHVGIQYADAAGVEHWKTASAKVITHPVLDVMDEDYREEKTGAYVGESLYVRVVDLGADVSDESDTVKVLMQAKSGAKHEVELLEVDNHSGVFRGPVELSYAQTPGAATAEAYSVKRDGFPVVYDDTLGARYSDSNGIKTDTRLLTIMKGADGTIRPFSKQYDDETIAMRTQFSLAEAYLEMAKRHRKLGESKLAEDEYARAKDMLEKAMDMFRDPNTRAQAEYLLGNLTQEEADVTDEAELKEDRYRAALSRYMRVTGSYPDTLPASKAQFKIATVYEQMNEPEIAAQEYVKLAYKYPDSEFLALSMARLGTHFQRKASAYEKQAKGLLAKTDDKDAQFDGKAMERMYFKEYIKSAEIFSRLQTRFPDHELAGKAGLRAGQAYMRAGENRDALNTFKRVFERESYDGPEIRAQAMYWAGMCYESLKEDMAAYSIYKRLTFDFPESKWASFARGQLSADKLLTLEENLEVKRVEEGR